MSKIELKPSEFLYPVPVVLVSCLDKNTKRANIVTVAWCGVVCSKPPLLSISIRPSRLSHRLITETGDFAVNIPTASLASKVDMCGVKSGRDTDKFKSCGFTAVAGSMISSPLIEECPVNIECALKDTLRLGTHDMFIGSVLCIHADKDVVSGGKIDFKKADPFVYNHGEYWDLGKKIGSYGYSASKG
jgi:flavin reductase (DIM6/NTAB) family NADH-FMN oxidoreductase RutF